MRARLFEKCHGNALVDDSDYCLVSLTHLHHGFDVRVLCVAHACSEDTATQHSCLREFNQVVPHTFALNSKHTLNARLEAHAGFLCPSFHHNFHVSEKERDA